MAEPDLNPLVTLGLVLARGCETDEEVYSTVATKFNLVKAGMADRNTAILTRRNWFDGNHWAEPSPGNEETSENQFRLVINYCKRVVLDFAGMLSRSPIPRVPIPVSEIPGDVDVTRAKKREALLMIAWPDFLEAWQRAELNAGKCGYGVIQVLWDPSVTPDEEIEETPTAPAPAVTPIEGNGQPPTPPPAATQPVKSRRYSELPMKFRSIKPEDFYPVYRTFDKSDDFLYVFRYEQNRLLADLEQRYDISLQATGTDESTSEATANLLEVWDAENYALFAETLVEDPLPVGAVSGLAARLRRVLRGKAYSTHYTALTHKKHGYKRIPFWVLQNVVDPDGNPAADGSLSDIDDIALLNEHLNLMRSEQAEEIVTNIHRPMVYKSPDHSQEPRSLSMTPGAVYPIGDDEDLEPLNYAPQPEYIQLHIADIERSIRFMSFLGDAGFGEFGAGTSGVSARIALTPMQRILELKMPPRIYCLRGIASFILRCFEARLGSDARLQAWVRTRGKQYSNIVVTPGDIKGDYYADVVYGNLLPRDDDSHQQNEGYKHGAGIQSLYRTIENLGEEDPLTEMKRLEQEANNVSLQPEKWLAIQQAKAAAAALQAPAPAAPATKPAQSTTPATPNAQTFPRSEGAGPGAAAPFLQRPMGGGAMPASMQPGPGVRRGGEG